jgi:hypothetical protein
VTIWENRLRQIRFAMDRDGLRAERKALRAIIRSGVYDERMFRAALVAVLNWDDDDVSGEAAFVNAGAA